MIDLKLTEEQLDELHKEASGNPCPRARKRCWVVYLKGKGYAHREIADVVRVDEDTVTEYVRKYRDGGLPGLLAEHYRKGEGQLDAHAERLKKVFENSPPHTVNQVLELLTDALHRAKVMGVGDQVVEESLQRGAANRQ